MELFIVIVLVIGFAGIIGNQYSILRRMERIEEALRDVSDNMKK